MSRPPASATLLFRIYARMTRAAAPVIHRQIARRMARKGVAADRIKEKRGQATLPRPAGQLIWFHAASVGESVSVLSLIGELGAHLPEASFLITSGTPTSADVVAQRMPARARHHFAPLDDPASVARFLDHWRPDAGIFVESELWPNLLMQAAGAGVPLALLNARLSRKSVEGWQKYPDTSAMILGCFSCMIAQNRQGVEDLKRMGADPDRVSLGGNLKAASPPLPVDAALAARVAPAFEGRFTWVASSTHAGEEEAVILAHRALRRSVADAGLILIPRHPERGDEVAALLADTGWTIARRSTGADPGADTDVFLADSLGETGTFYSLAPIVFLGGSLEQIGGHNPYEPAQAGAAVLSGRHVTNFAESFDPLMRIGGGAFVEDGADLGNQLTALARDPARISTMQQAAGQFAGTARGTLDDIAAQLIKNLNLSS